MTTIHGFSRRRFLTNGAAIGIYSSVSGCTMSGVVREASGVAVWRDIEAPDTPRIRNVITQLGRSRTDWYSWLKYIPSEGQRDLATMPPRLSQQLLEEQSYTNAMLAPLAQRKEELITAMFERTGGGLAEPPLPSTGWAYFSEKLPNQKFPVHRRRLPDGTTETLLDENSRAADSTYFRTTGHQTSLDDRYFTWAEDVVGNDRHRIVVHDTRLSKTRVIVDTDAYGYGGLVFSPSSRWLFWIWRDSLNRPRRLYRSAIDGSETELIYEEADPGIFMQIGRSAKGGLVSIMLSGPDTSEVRVIRAEDERAQPVVVRARQRNVRYELEEWRDSVVLLTDAGGAFDKKIVRLTDIGAADETVLVPHKPDREIIALYPFRKGLVRLERENSAQRVVILSPQGKECLIDFGSEPAALEIPSGQDYRSQVVRVIYQSPKQPRQWYDVDLITGARRLVDEERLTNFRSEDYEVERLFGPAEDGEMIPITLLSRKGAPKDGTMPLLLYGYGAYGVSSEPEFSVPVSVLVDQGWRYAIAHVRGGSEKGRRWFLDGRALSKRNSFTDFIACAEFLSDESYSSAQKTVAYGVSAGGLLVGASMTIRPDMWAGVIAEVPFVDMLNTMSDANHPLVPLFRPDWGDPLADPKAYDYIASISPYENALPAAYPPLLCTAGLQDDRVGYWEPAKLVAQVRHHTLSDNPAILDLDETIGHQASGSNVDAFAKYSLFWSFAERCVMQANGDAEVAASYETFESGATNG